MKGRTIARWTLHTGAVSDGEKPARLQYRRGTHRDIYLLSVRFDANGSDDGFCTVRQLLRRLLYQKRGKPVGEKDEVSSVRFRISEDGQDTLVGPQSGIAEQKRGNYLHLRRLRQQGEVESLTADVRRAVCD